MKKENEKSFGLRVDADILAKFRYVCDYEGRSANRQLVRLMLEFIAAYESKNGTITLEEEKQDVQ